MSAFPEFIVKDEDNDCYERRIVAVNEREAAERWAEKTFGDRDYSQFPTAVVTDAAGIVTRWAVETRSEPVFYASRAPDLQKATHEVPK